MAAIKKRTKRVDGAANITDGCNPELVDGARFAGLLEIPVIEKPDKLMVPGRMVPFSKMNRVEDSRRFAVCEYELDVEITAAVEQEGTIASDNTRARRQKRMPWNYLKASDRAGRGSSLGMACFD